MDIIVAELVLCADNNVQFALPNLTLLNRCFMNELLGIDYGDRWVGTAVGTAEVRVALPLETFERYQGKAERAILSLLSKRKISTVVVGLPLSDDGTENPQCAKVKRFCSRLQKRAKFDIIYRDEYLTTSEAQSRLASSRMLGNGGGRVDSVSASIILQEYLDSLST